MSEKADDVQKADQAAWRTWHKKPMIVVGLLWFAAVLCGSGIWAGAGISCSSDEAKASFERKDASCRKFNRKYPTVSMLMLHRPAKNAMRGFVIPGILVNGAADLGLAAKLGDRYRGDGAKCANMSAALFAVMSLIAILIGMGTNPRGMTHVTACVTWAFFRMIWGWLLLCVVCTSCNCGPIQLAYTVVRVVLRRRPNVPGPEAGDAGPLGQHAGPPRDDGRDWGIDLPGVPHARGRGLVGARGGRGADDDDVGGGAGRHQTGFSSHTCSCNKPKSRRGQGLAARPLDRAHQNGFSSHTSLQKRKLVGARKFASGFPARRLSLDGFVCNKSSQSSASKARQVRPQHLPSRKDRFG